MNNRILIRLKSLVSYAGSLVETEEQNGKIISYSLKPSDNSNVLIVIPASEIDRVFLMDGRILVEEDIYDGCNIR